MPKSSRKSQPSKKLRSETPPPSELEDAITSELAEGRASVTPTPSTYVVSEADTVSGASSAGEDNFVTPLPVVPAPTGKAPKTPPPAQTPVSYTHLTLPTIYSV